jgi:hypothetical protein
MSQYREALLDLQTDTKTPRQTEINMEILLSGDKKKCSAPKDYLLALTKLLGPKP